MDRNSVIGLVLIMVMVIAWSLVMSPDDPGTTPPNAPETQAATSASPDSLADAPQLSAGNDSLAPADPAKDSLIAAEALNARFGRFAPLTEGKAETVRVRTADLDVVFSTQGASPIAAYLRQFKTYSGAPLPIIAPIASNHFSFVFNHERRTIETSQLFFVPSKRGEIDLKPSDSLQLRFRAEIEPGKYLDLIYHFRGKGHDLTLETRFVGLSDIITDNIYFLDITQHVPLTEKSFDKMLPAVNMLYKYGEDIEKLDATATEPETLTEDGRIQWVSFKSQFFSMAVMPETGAFERIKLKQEPSTKPGSVKAQSASLQLAFTRGATHTERLTLYLGPNDVYVLNDYGNQLEKQVELGWFFIGWINRWIILPTFKFLESFGWNYGLIIFVLAVLIKILVLPLTWRSYLSTAKLQIVNKMPEVKEIDEKFKDDPQKAQVAKMAFYRQAGVNPLGGCVPLLLQFPILIAMFTFFPASIELRQQGFLWADDLSTYDSIWDFGYVPIINTIYGDHVSLFTLLMTASQILYTYITQKQQGSAVNNQMKYLGYIMPVVFMGILNNYSAALSYYYLCTNILTIGQTFLIKRFVDEDALMKKLETIKAQKAKKANGAPPKSRMQQWLEDQQKKQDKAKSANRLSKPSALPKGKK